jgi:hypothetical protein
MSYICFKLLVSLFCVTSVIDEVVMKLQYEVTYLRSTFLCYKESSDYTFPWTDRHWEKTIALIARAVQSTAGQYRHRVLRTTRSEPSQYRSMPWNTCLQSYRQPEVTDLLLREEMATRTLTTDLLWRHYHLHTNWDTPHVCGFNTLTGKPTSVWDKGIFTFKSV